MSEKVIGTGLLSFRDAKGERIHPRMDERDCCDSSGLDNIKSTVASDALLLGQCRGLQLNRSMPAATTVRSNDAVAGSQARLAELPEQLAEHSGRQQIGQ